jgi:hypothetical protein
LIVAELPGHFAFFPAAGMGWEAAHRVISYWQAAADAKGILVSTVDISTQCRVHGYRRNGVVRFLFITT